MALVKMKSMYSFVVKCHHCTDLCLLLHMVQCSSNRRLGVGFQIKLSLNSKHIKASTKLPLFEQINTSVKCIYTKDCLIADSTTGLLSWLRVLLSFQNNKGERRLILLSYILPFLRCQGCKNFETFVIVKTKLFIEQIMLKQSQEGN